MTDEPVKTTDEEGTIEYRLNGVLHCEDGPAWETNPRLIFRS